VSTATKIYADLQSLARTRGRATSEIQLPCLTRTHADVHGRSSSIPMAR
jgi:hypothetical protein